MSYKFLKFDISSASYLSQPGDPIDQSKRGCSLRAIYIEKIEQAKGNIHLSVLLIYGSIEVIFINKSRWFCSEKIMYEIPYNSQQLSKKKVQWTLFGLIRKGKLSPYILALFLLPSGVQNWTDHKYHVFRRPEPSFSPRNGSFFNFKPFSKTNGDFPIQIHKNASIVANSVASYPSNREKLRHKWAHFGKEITRTMTLKYTKSKKI